MTVAVSILIAVLVVATSVSLNLMRRRLEAAGVVRSTLVEENAMLNRQLARAEVLAANLRQQLEQALSKSEDSRIVAVVPPVQAAPDREVAEERVDSAGRWRTSGIQELGARRTVLRMPHPEDILALAEHLWRTAGEPQGRDREFWFQAELQLIAEQVALRAAADQKPALDDASSAVG